MGAHRADSKRAWLAAVLGSAGVLGAVAVLFGFSRPPAVGPAVAPPTVRQPLELAGARASELLAEEAAMRDLTPLFLPTERNAAPKKLEMREPGDRFLDVQLPQLSFSDAAPPLLRSLPAPVTLNGKPVAQARPTDAAGLDAPATPLFGFGRGETEVGDLRPRGALIEIVSSNDGKQIVSDSLPPEARPATEQNWQPLEFLVVVDAAGLVDRPTLVTGSRAAEVDQHFENYLVKRYRIGDRLRPGFYRITLAP